MTKIRGSRNYSDDEQRLLLEILADHMPRKAPDWSAVAKLYNSRRREAWMGMTPKSLKRKFMCLCAAASKRPHEFENEVENLALEVKRKIAKSARAPETAMHVTLPSASERPDTECDGESGFCYTRSRVTSVAADDAESTLPRSSVSLTSPEVSRVVLRDLDTAPCICSRTETHHSHRHMECGVIELFLWFQKRDKQTVEQWNCIQRNLFDVDRKHDQLLESISELKKNT
ncbi:hypothetical protein F441_10508 [Phytophthora nicotianae CJ01A1]|uniref:Uncharacterized protein n=1 Tax=Phytophthora nicotianae CJ01A1 TaxID=1317063 RepID=W2WVL6_PHYNI|nr:hypothetical protein F441_10508 [Phytophthora nicotianae CJ01A1]